MYKRQESWSGSELNRAKEILAYELTKMVHSKEDADKALEAARALFSAGSDSANMPSTALAAADFSDGQIGILDLLVKTGLAPSKKEARRLIEQGGITLDDNKVENVNLCCTADQIANGIVIKKGKKVFHKVMLAQ